MTGAPTRNKRPPRRKSRPNIFLTGLEPPAAGATLEYDLPPESAIMAPAIAPPTAPPIAPPKIGNMFTQPGTCLISPGAAEVALAREAWQLGHTVSVAISCV